jgi:hypothetical protein
MTQLLGKHNQPLAEETRKPIIKFLKDWKDYLNGLVPADWTELDWSGNDSDTPIYDQLEREWAKKRGSMGNV